MLRTLSMICGLALIIVTYPLFDSLAKDTALARKLLNSQGCKACHTFEGDGGREAGSFEEMRERLSWAEIRLQLVNQTGTHAGGSMPDFSHLSDEEIEALIYLIKPREQEHNP
jgi:mono/diheme cytochrome c family protein